MKENIPATPQNHNPTYPYSIIKEIIDKSIIYPFPIINSPAIKPYYLLIQTDPNQLAKMGYFLLEKINVNGYDGTILGTASYSKQGTFAVIAHQDGNNLPMIYPIPDKNTFSKIHKISQATNSYLSSSILFYIEQAYIHLNLGFYSNLTNSIKKEIELKNISRINYSLADPNFHSENYIIDSSKIKDFTQNRFEFLSTVATKYGTGVVIGLANIDSEHTLVVMLDLQVKPLFLKTKEINDIYFIPNIIPCIHTLHLIQNAIKNRTLEFSGPTLFDDEFYRIYKDIILEFHPKQNEKILEKILKYGKLFIDINACRKVEIHEKFPFDQPKYYYIKVYILIYTYFIYSQPDHPFFADLPKSDSKDFYQTVLTTLATSAILANKYMSDIKVDIYTRDIILSNETYNPNYTKFNKYVQLAFQLLNYNVALEMLPSMAIPILSEFNREFLLSPALQTFTKLQEEAELADQIELDEKRERQYLQSITSPFWSLKETQARESWAEEKLTSFCKLEIGN